VQSIPVMGTIVSIEIVSTDHHPADEIDDGIADALEWFRQVERICNRFDPESELSRLTKRAGVPVQASELLYAAVEFALIVAEDTGGAFDPTVGREMEARGFNRDYRDGRSVHTPLPDDPVNYRDIALDPATKTITLKRPLLLDLGAVAKGLAIDLAARELADFRHFVIDAGGDLYVAGHKAGGQPWSVGIRHPRRDREVIELVRVSDAAVCTSGDYERQESGDGHHILDPRNVRAADVVASATVVAPTAMLADALATAAFVLGPIEGIRLLERHGVDGVLLSPAAERFSTRGMRSAILPDA
jgi:thiamine biosynthesis lipoprotein